MVHRISSCQGPEFWAAIKRIRREVNVKTVKSIGKTEALVVSPKAELVTWALTVSCL